MSRDVMKIAHSAMSDVDPRVLPPGVDVNFVAARELLRNELEATKPAPKTASGTAKVVKKKAKKKVSKKK